MRRNAGFENPVDKRSIPQVKKYTMFLFYVFAEQNWLAENPYILSKKSEKKGVLFGSFWGPFSVVLESKVAFW